MEEKRKTELVKEWQREWFPRFGWIHRKEVKLRCKFQCLGLWLEGNAFGGVTLAMMGRHVSGWQAGLPLLLWARQDGGNQRPKFRCHPSGELTAACRRNPKRAPIFSYLFGLWHSLPLAASIYNSLTFLPSVIHLCYPGLMLVSWMWQEPSWFRALSIPYSLFVCPYFCFFQSGQLWIIPQIKCSIISWNCIPSHTWGVRDGWTSGLFPFLMTTLPKEFCMWPSPCPPLRPPLRWSTQICAISEAPWTCHSFPLLSPHPEGCVPCICLVSPY